MIFGPFRALFVLGLVGACVGIFFGVKGALTAKDAVSSVNRKGGDEKSMFHAKRLDAGLDKVRAEVGADGHLLSLNIHPGYLQVDASTGSEDKARSFRIQDNGRVDEMPVTLIGPGKLADNVFPIEKLNTATVEKLALQAADKEHLDGLDDVSHIVVNIQPDSGKPGINVYLKNQRFWRAALDGRGGLTSPDQQARAALESVEEMAAPETAAPSASADASADAADSAASPAEDLAACVQAAGTNAAKVAACTK